MNHAPTADPILPTPHLWLHRFAILSAAATFPLIFIGGLVTTYDVGMAVTDWPTTRGQNMFTYPWLRDFNGAWGVFIEHSHRLMGALVGLLTLVLAGWVWAQVRRPGVRWLAAAALAAVLIQGLLGGLRVILNDRVVAVIHAAFAQAFFVLIVCLALVTSRGWERGGPPAAVDDAGRIRRLAWATAGFVFLQLVLGAILRHLGIGLIPHLVVAAVVVVHVGLIARRILGQQSDKPPLLRPVALLSVLVSGQLVLGAGAWWTSSGFGPHAMEVPSRGQVFFATAHVAVGALILATAVVLAIESHRRLAPAARRPRPQGSPESRRSRVAQASPSVRSLEPRDLLADGGLA